MKQQPKKKEERKQPNPSHENRLITLVGYKSIFKFLSLIKHTKHSK